MNKKFDIHN